MDEEQGSRRGALAGVGAADALEPGGDTVGERTLAALPWFVGARGVSEALAFASSILLARLLTPAQFGDAVVALIFVNLDSSVLGEGITSALTQRRSVGESAYESGAFIALCLGLVLSALTIYPGAALAGELISPNAGDVVVLVAPYLLLTAIGVVPRARLQRRLDFRSLGVIDATSSLVSVPVTVGLAAAGLDGRAIVAGLIASAAVQVVMLQRAAGGARPRLDGESAKGIIAYGLPASLGSLIYTGFRNIDYIIVGAAISPQALGLYFRAYSLAYEYQGKVSGILLRMSLSIYSRANDVAQMRSIRTRITRVHAVVIFPLMGLLAVTAPLLIPWLYGSAWSGAIVPAQILAAAGAVAAVLTGTGPFVLALGRPRVMLVWNVGLLTGYTLTVLLTVQGGLVTLCWGVLGFQVINFVLAHVLLLWRVGGIPFARMLSEMLPAAAGTAMLVAGAFAVRTSLEGRVPTALTLALTAVAGGVVYLVVIRQAFPAAFTDLDILLRRTVPSGLVRRLGWGRG